MTNYIYEYRDGKHPLNKTDWGIRGMWDGDRLVFGDRTGWNGGFEEPTPEEAEFMIMCINNHVPLVEALEETLNRLVAATTLLEHGGRGSLSDELYSFIHDDYMNTIRQAQLLLRSLPDDDE